MEGHEYIEYRVRLIRIIYRIYQQSESAGMLNSIIKLDPLSFSE